MTRYKLGAHGGSVTPIRAPEKSFNANLPLYKPSLLRLNCGKSDPVWQARIGNTIP
jgi:hypothetical protein